MYQDKIPEDTEIFDLSIDIPIKYQVTPGRQRNAMAKIIDSTRKFSVHA